MQILDFLVAINGVGQLWGANGQFLGLLSNNQYDSNSISNPHGMYGGQHGLYSISNPHGMYGGQHGLYSPYNSFCLNPPIIFFQGQPVIIVTRNAYIQNQGLAVIDPDLLLGLYAQLTSSNPALRSVPTQLDYLTRASQTIAQCFY